MQIIKNNIRHSLLASMILAFSACGTVFEDGDICPIVPPSPLPDSIPEATISYKVRFDDSYNMNYADAFSSEIKSLTLFVLDSSSKSLVWTYDETDQEKLKKGNYTIDLPLTPGNYDLVAWCGITGTDPVPSFSLTTTPELEKTTIDQLKTKLSVGKESADNVIVHSDPLTELHHGILREQNLTKHDTTLVVPLVRNTNNVRVVLQRIDGTDLDAADFDFCVEASNGQMNYDNQLLKDSQREFRAYNKTNKAGTNNGTVVLAEMSLARMVLDQNMRLKATYKDKTLLNIPLIKYALLIKGYYYDTMDDQEFLDRQNDWNFIFFLNENNQWEQSNLYINDWHVILNNLVL